MAGLSVAAAERRQMILDSAAELFRTRGFHGAGMDDIAAAAGVTGPAIYRHFPGKDALLVTLFDQLGERLEETVARARTGSRTGRERLESLVAGHVRLALDHRAMIVLWLTEERNLPEPDRRRARRAMRAYVEEWAELLRPLRPELSDEERRTSVHAAIGLANSIGSRHHIELPRPELERLLTRMALVALLTP